MAEILIVIPAYNSQCFLGQAIDSVIKQTFEDWKLVVIDDGSTDNSSAIAGSFSLYDSRIVSFKQSNAGVANTRNRGLLFADSDTRYVLLLDNDDVLEPNALALLRARLAICPAAGAAYGLPQDIDADGRVLSPGMTKSYGYKRLHVRGRSLRRVPQNAPTDFSALVVWPCIATPGQVLIRLEALREIGDFDPATVPSDDWDLWLRLSLRYPLEMVPEVVLNKRIHSGNVSAKGSVMAAAEPAIRHKLATSEALTPEQRRIARRGHLYSCAMRLVWAAGDIAEGRILNSLKNVRRAFLSFSRFRATPYRLPKTA